MLAIATGGLAINFINLWILRGGKNENLNVRGAWLHVMADALGSIGAIIAALAIMWFGWEWADPVASFLIAGLVVFSAWGLIRETLDVLMEGVPKHIDLQKVNETLCALPGVVDVHDLHIWSLTSGRHVATAHLAINKGVSHQAVVDASHKALTGDFGIHHTTIQVEDVDRSVHCNPCDSPEENVKAAS